MYTISELSRRFEIEERPAGNLLTTIEIEAQAIAATIFYSGYTKLESLETEIDGNTELNNSEWAIIRGLFMLYIERENSIHIEASNGMGISSYGRTSSEVAQDITTYENELPLKAFSREIITI